MFEKMNEKKKTKHKIMKIIYFIMNCKKKKIYNIIFNYFIILLKII